MGFPWQDVKHVRIAHEQVLGTAALDPIERIGTIQQHASPFVDPGKKATVILTKALLRQDVRCLL